MKKVLLTTHYEGKPAELIQACNGGHFELLIPEQTSQEELLKRAGDADYLLVSGRLLIDEELLSKAKNLKMVQRTGVGLDNFDLDALKRRNIPLYVNQGINATSVAEYAMMLMLSLLKENSLIGAETRDGHWKKQEYGIGIRELSGKTVGLIGIGNIGKRVARMLGGFGCKVIYHDPYRADEETEKAYDITYADFDELIRTADIISLHCSYDKEKGAIITSNEINQMKDDVILINTARGKLIREDDLIKALKDGRIKACGLDTFEEEPLPLDSELRHLDNVLLSPHVAGLSYESYERMFTQAFHNLIAFDEGDLDSIAESRYL